MRYLINFGAILFFGLFAEGSGQPAGSECGAEKDLTPTVLSSVFGLDTAGAAVSTKIGPEATAAVNSISFDSSAAADWLKEATKGKGWTAERIASAVADMIVDATAQLNDLIKLELPKMINGAKATFDTSIQKLTPQAKFQSDLTWKERCCSEATWADAAANKAGVNGADGEGKLEISFEIGASAGASLTTKASLSASIGVGIKLTGFNPVRPKSGSGASFTINATPLYDWNVKVSGGGGVLLKITVGAGLTGSETLSDVSGTLNCS